MYIFLDMPTHSNKFTLPFQAQYPHFLLRWGLIPRIPTAVLIQADERLYSAQRDMFSTEGLCKVLILSISPITNCK